MAVYDTSPIHLIWDTKGGGNAFPHHEPIPRLARETSLKAHKQLPRRRDVEDSILVPKTRYTILRRPADIALHESESQTPTPIVSKTSPNPVLPLTPPTAHLESDEEDETLTPVTPTRLHKPPTPDYTPPRRFLGSQLSLASTRAESFRTAREDFVSDDDFNPPVFESRQPARRSPGTLSSIPQHPRRPNQLMNGIRHTPGIAAPADIALPDSTSTIRSLALSPKSQIRITPGTEEYMRGENPEQLSHHAHLLTTISREISASPAEASEPRETTPEQQTPETTDGVPQRGLSLRERVFEARQNMARRSTEDFGNAIGWSRQNEDAEDLEEAVDSWRQSTISTVSMIEAFVVDTPPKRNQTLRHIGRNVSLRCASSPIPAPRRKSGRHPDESPLRSISMSEPPKLHHKKAQLSDQSRWSYGSEVSRSLSLTSCGVLPRAETEVIRVAVIPERTSSLKSSANSSRRVSVVTAGTRSGSGEQYPPSSYHARENSADVPHRRRTLSDTDGGPMNRDVTDSQRAPIVPPRASSLSAPTSRNNSRSNSMSSSSDHFRHRRIAAEKDLRKTLDQMESERLLPTLGSSQERQAPAPLDYEFAEDTPSRPARKLGNLVIEDNRRKTSDRGPGAASLPEPGSDGWANLRPASLLDTPFSQPSNMSPSPGPFEMGEATAVNFFPHHNDSLQLIEKRPLPESRAVRDVQQRLLDNEPSTPSTTTQVFAQVDSPLRNPREPPEPPRFKVIPPTPAADNVDKQLGGRNHSTRRPPLSKRAYSESFVKSLTRNLSLKNARNRRAGQDLDGKLHPMWRPRDFWDGVSESDDETLPEQERGVVQNSLGIPQERTTVTGPISLVRRISDSGRRRWQGRRGGVIKKSSYGSLSKLRTGRKLHLPFGSGLRFQIIGLRDVQERMLVAKQRKEDERREKRRADLRRSIGRDVVSQGDSRFPMANMENNSEDF